MNKLIAALLCLTLGIVMIGAAPPPSGDTGLYVDDGAGLLSETHRAAIERISADLYARTGIHAAVVTVKSLDDMAPEDYGRQVVSARQIGGEHGADGILILVSSTDRISRVFVGENLATLSAGQSNSIQSRGAKASRSIFDAFCSLALEAYRLKGIIPTDDIQSVLAPTPSGGPFSGGVIILLAVVLLATGRSFRVSRKYRQKYLKGHVRKRKTYTKTYDEEAQYKNEKIYKITYDDDD